MERPFDVPLRTPPLQHITKDRAKNTSRRVSMPSRNHLMKNSVVDKNGLLENLEIPAFGNMGSPQNKKLKLPPPPVAKKPKRNANVNKDRPAVGFEKDGEIALKNAKEIAQTNTVVEKEQNSESHNLVKVSEVSSKKKPDILPKPVLPGKLQTNVTTGFTKRRSGAVQGPEDTSLGSPVQDQTAKTPLSFSERLRASSLSRRSDQNGPDGLGTKLRSHIISPVRRGSRSYMSTDSPFEKEHTAKPSLPPPPIFKRYSSESNIDTEDGKIDLEKLEASEITSVQPLLINSALLTNSFDDEDEDEEGTSKDSFGSKELGIKDAIKTEEINNETKQTDFVLNLLLPKNEPFLEEPEENNVNSYDQIFGDLSSVKFDDALEIESEAAPVDVLSLSDSNLVKTTGREKLSAAVTDSSAVKYEQKAVATHSQNTDTKHNLQDSLGKSTLSSSIFSSVRRLRNSPKETSNTRRKFRPIGSVELPADIQETAQCLPRSDGNTGDMIIPDASISLPNSKNDISDAKSDIFIAENNYPHPKNNTNSDLKKYFPDSSVDSPQSEMLRSPKETISDVVYMDTTGSSLEMVTQDLELSNDPSLILEKSTDNQIEDPSDYEEKLPAPFMNTDILHANNGNIATLDLLEGL